MARAQAISADKDITAKEAVEAEKSTDQTWWMRLVLGMAAVVFGIAAVFWPNLTMETLVYLFSAFIVVWGLIEFINGLLKLDKVRSAWLALVFGAGALATGVFLVRDPSVAVQTFMLLVGFLLVVRGVFWVVETFLDQITDSAHRTLSIVTGAAALTAGIVLLLQPATSGIEFVWILGLFALLFGAISIVLALRGQYEKQA